MKLTIDQKIALREVLKTKLSMGISEVVFEKADGTMRVMKATRDSKLLSEKRESDGYQVSRAESTDMIPAFDIELNQWRGFSFDKIVSVNGTKVEHLIKFIG